MTNTARLGLPLLAAAQAQKHVTHNEALLALDALVQVACLDRDLASPPPSPAEGARYIVAAGASGAWAGHDDALAEWRDGAWRLTPARAGFVAFLADEAILVVHDGTAWRPLGARLGAVQEVTRLGLGTTADAANPLAAKLNAALLTARGAGEGGTGDLRVVLNKEAPSRTLSLLLQSGYAGRAEIGLAGDDDLHVKVSGDGANWVEALRVKPSGAVAIGAASAPERLTVGGNVAPAADNAYTLGTATLRFASVWSATGTISTSDLRLKRDVAPIDGDHAARLLAAAPPIAFRWSHGEGARHFGWAAQAWQTALAASDPDAGLVASPGETAPETPLGIRPDQVAALLHAALLRLSERVAALEERLAAEAGQRVGTGCSPR